MKALVTGAGGFIGSFLSRGLIERWVREVYIPGRKRKGN
jgi:nucleoside-diphosphate-sugar epimerase